MTKKKDPSYVPLLNCQGIDKKLRIFFSNFSSIYDTMTNKLGRDKAPRVTFIEDVEGIDIFLKSSNMMPFQGRGEKRLRE